MEPVEYQFYAFFVMIMAGVLIGIIFDFYRIIRNFIRPKKIATGIGDILFWIFVTIVAFILLVFGNWGELRLYVFIGLAIGVRLHFRLFSKFCIKVFKNLFKLTGKMISFIWRTLIFTLGLLLMPFKLLKKVVIIPLGLISLAFGRINGFFGGFAKRFLIRPVKSRWHRVKRKIRLKLIAILKKSKK